MIPTDYLGLFGYFFTGGPPLFWPWGRGPINPPDPAIVLMDRNDQNSNKTNNSNRSHDKNVYWAYAFMGSQNKKRGRINVFLGYHSTNEVILCFWSVVHCNTWKRSEESFMISSPVYPLTKKKKPTSGFVILSELSAESKWEICDFGGSPGKTHGWI